MVRYLSAAWFQRLTEQRVAPAAGSATIPDALPPLVLRQVVLGGPDGEVRYDVVVHDGRATIDPDLSAPADLTFTSDYATAAAIAAGRLSTHAALSDGLLRIGGDATLLTRRGTEVVTVDPVPAGLRAETEY
jgi:hypothetical protein